MNRLLQSDSLLVLNRGCEIGVREGMFSSFLLKNNPNLHMTLVDPYEEYQDWSMYYSSTHQNRFKEQSSNMLKAYAPRYTFVYKYSAEAYKDFEDRYFDFVYIDAKHTYENVLADCSVWFMKVREDGILCGHDYSMEQVRRAVHEAARMLNKKVFNSEYKNGDSWWIYM